MGYIAPAFEPFTITETSRQSILKTLQNLKSKKSQKYFLIYGIHLDIDKVIWVNLAILGKVLHGLE